ncbi:MAG: hypothetical protein Q3M30_04385 [Candidatus Electrothrix sp. Rat3]|nr:hypothetical protein [Candidatus Electrothrix rattekaaiensis]
MAERICHTPYLADKHKVVLIGLGFDKAERNLIDYSEAAEVP